MINNKQGQLLMTLGIIFGAIVLFGIIIILWAVGAYNGLVSKDTGVQQLWGNVESAYQRRIDLIPNLVETVKGAAAFEKDTYVAVTEARTKYLGASTVSEKQAAQGELDSALARLMVVVENYPQLKANQNFLGLQDELAGTENRIKWERDKYNEGVCDYQTAVRRFPSNIIAGMFGFSVDKWQTFKADTGAKDAPKVNF